MGKITRQELSSELSEELDGFGAAGGDLDEHKADNVPHVYKDTGDNPDFQDVKYKIVVVNGKSYMEVVDA